MWRLTTAIGAIFPEDSTFDKLRWLVSIVEPGPKGCFDPLGDNLVPGGCQRQRDRRIGSCYEFSGAE